MTQLSCFLLFTLLVTRKDLQQTHWERGREGGREREGEGREGGREGGRGREGERGRREGVIAH